MVLCPLAAAAQDPAPKIIVVPYPGEVADAGVPAQPPPTTVEVPAQPPPDVPPAEQPETRTIEALTPKTPTEELPPPPTVTAPPEGPGAFLDGHPREGAFLSGPGSLTFILHHSIMGGLGLLATQMVPRLVDGYCLGAAAGTCTNNTDIAWGVDARIAYLAGTLIGAGVGFGATATWQFFHWMNYTTASFGILNSAFGGMFMFGIVDLFTKSATALSWVTLMGALAGAWLTAIVGGGDMPLNKGLLIVSGGAWAMIYTALIIAVVATTGGGGNLRGGIDALLITPAIGAGAMAAATLKFNPSTAQIMRANLFGVGAGAAVLLLSALVLGANFASPVPYVLAAVSAVGAKTVVSLLWAEAAESPAPAPPPQSFAPAEGRREKKVIWW